MSPTGFVQWWTMTPTGVLELLGCQTGSLPIAEAGDGMEALGKMPDEVAILLSDVNMPKMGGLELARKVLKERPDIKVVLMSSYDIEPPEKLPKGANFLLKNASLRSELPKLLQQLIVQTTFWQVTYLHFGQPANPLI